MPIRVSLLMVMLTATVCAPALTSRYGVEVRVRPEKPEYLVGEPVFIVIEVRNVGTGALIWGQFARARMEVVSGTPKQLPKLRGCGAGTGVGGGIGGGLSHPPQLKPGETKSYRELLQGYVLGPTEYDVRVQGRAPVSVPSAETAVPVEGIDFHQVIRLRLKGASETELRRAYGPVLADLEQFFDPLRRRQAAEGIAEMAPPFLEKKLAYMSRQEDLAGFAVTGLRNLGTATARASLVELYDRADNLGTRLHIVSALAHVATPELSDFFTSLLPGRSTPADDSIRIYALLGLGRIGGAAAANTLASLPRSPNLEVRRAVVQALGNTRAREAVSHLISMFQEQELQNDVYWALQTLTHWRWSTGTVEPYQERRNRWLRWWEQRREAVIIYGPEECPAWDADLPFVE